MTAKSLETAGFSGRVLDSSSPHFAEASRRFSALAERRNKLIAFPASSEDVSKAILFAIKENLKIAVKGGGHHACGASSIEDGLVIDLADLKKVEVDKQNMRVTVGGGCVWGDVYAALHEEALACVGGGVHNVGVGGHLTGGGYGPLTPKYGMACENVISATVVLADGRIVPASDAANTDLFWAIKGGSSQFGVVADFVLRTYPGPRHWFSTAFMYPGSVLPELIPLLRELVEEYPAEETGAFAILILARGPPPEYQPLVVLNFHGIGPPSRHDDVLRPIRETLKPLDVQTTEFANLEEFSHDLDKVLLLQPRRIVTGGLPITGLWPGMVEEAWVRFLEYTNSHLDSMSTILMFEMHGTKRISPSSTAYPIYEDHHCVVISEAHRYDTNDSDAFSWVTATSDMLRSYQRQGSGKDLGLNPNACMLHYRTEEVYGSNYPRLQQIKAKYDPDCIFDRFFHIAPQRSPVKL